MQTLEEFISQLDVNILFRSRPVAVPPDLRPLWRVSILLLILRKCCRNSRCSFYKAHILNWSVRTRETRSVLLQYLRGTVPPDEVLVRIEPELNRAVDFAQGFGYVRVVGGQHIELMPAGTEMAARIDQSSALATEMRYLLEVGQNLTEEKAGHIFNLTKSRP